MPSAQDLYRGDLDMARLHKSPKQQRKEPFRKNIVTKLTPAEIRSLNNSVVSQKRNGSTSSGSYNADRHTPPRTPETALPRQLSTSGRNSMSLPTPPHSPDSTALRREDSASRNVTHIHSPIPQTYSKTGLVLANGTGSRPPSAASQRGMPTYRGPEMTRTGSYSMLHSSKLTHQIVDNPLSQFSRPRQSRASVSPSSQQQKQYPSSEHSIARSHRSHSLPISTTLPEEAVDSYHVAGSPVSARVDEHFEATIADNMHVVDDARVTDHVRPSEPAGADVQKNTTIAVDGTSPVEPHSKFIWKWRKGSSSSREEVENVEPRKPRRRTISGSKISPEIVRVVAYENTKPGAAPEERDSLKGNLPSSKTSVYPDSEDNRPKEADSFDTHPAVRPLGSSVSVQSESHKRGKERELEEREDDSHNVLADDSVPMYSRCSCCGKIKKPAGNRSLSPVFENENLRTNFSIEMGRTDNEEARRMRSGSLGKRSKSTPIIPMVLPQGNTVQARIGPRDTVFVQQPAEPMPMVNSRGDIIAQGSEPILLAPLSVEESNRKVVRFSSLYAPGEIRKTTYVNVMASTKEESNQPDAATSGITEAKPEHQPTIETHPNARHQQSGNRVSNSMPNHLTKNVGLPAPASEEATGELMAALSGVDLSFDYTASKSAEHLGKAGTGDRVGERSPAVEAQSLGKGDTVPGMALTTDDTIFQTAPASVSIISRSAPRLVSLRPRTAEQQKSSINQGSPSTSRKRHSSRETKYTYHNGQIIAYTDYTPTDTVSKPTATAQNAIRENTNTEIEKPYDIRGSSDLAVRNDTIIVPAQKGSEARRTNQLANHNTSTYRDIRSSTYEPLPEPNFGKHFGESSGTFRSYVLPPGKFQSNLVESVLAATNGDHDHDHFVGVRGR